MWIAAIIVVVLIIGITLWLFVRKRKMANYAQELENYMAEQNERSFYEGLANEYNLKGKPLTDINESLTRSQEAERLSDEIKKNIINVIKAYKEPSNDSSARHSIKVESLPHDGNSFEAWRKSHPTFQQLLLKYIEEKGISNVEFYNAAWIDRKLFSAIKNNELYKPKKETAVACCLGLELTSTEATKLLKAAGYALSDSIVWDRVIEHCIENKIYKIDQVNEILFELGEKCIGE